METINLLRVLSIKIPKQHLLHNIFLCLCGTTDLLLIRIKERYYNFLHNCYKCINLNIIWRCEEAAHPSGARSSKSVKERSLSSPSYNISGLMESWHLWPTGSQICRPVSAGALESLGGPTKTQISRH